MTAELGEGIARAVTGRWPERGPRWVAGLREELRDVCEELGVMPGRVFAARFAFVVEAATPAGAQVVLKSSAAPDAGHQADVLAALSAIGAAPPVQLVRRTPTAVWSVMDPVTPGIPLSQADLGPEHWTAARTLLGVLTTGGPGPASVPDLVPWMRDRLVDPPEDDQPPGRGPAAPAVREAALTALDELLPVPSGLLCHADLSLNNVLCGDGRLWVVDPRGLNGEPAYDVAVVALKASLGDVDRGRQLAASLADSAGVDVRRAEQWVGIAAAATV